MVPSRGQMQRDLGLSCSWERHVADRLLQVEVVTGTAYASVT